MSLRFKFRNPQKDVKPLSPAAPDFTTLRFHTEKKPMPEWQRAKLPRRPSQRLIRIARDLLMPVLLVSVGGIC